MDIFSSDISDACAPEASAMAGLATGDKIHRLKVTLVSLKIIETLEPDKIWWLEATLIRNIDSIEDSFEIIEIS